MYLKVPDWQIVVYGAAHGASNVADEKSFAKHHRERHSCAVLMKETCSLDSLLLYEHIGVQINPRKIPLTSEDLRPIAVNFIEHPSLCCIKGRGVWTCEIDNLCRWVPGGGGGGSWQKYFPCDSNGLSLRICHDILLINQSDKCIESLNLASSKMKGFIKGTVMIIAISGQDNCIRKIKFELKCSPKEGAECIRLLMQFVPVQDRNTKKILGKRENFTFRPLNETLQQILENKNNDQPPQMPTPFKDFVRLCLLDPDFPRLIVETENIVKELMTE